jgi:hypothetical protein
MTIEQMENKEDEEGREEDSDDDRFFELLHSNLEDKELEPALDSPVDLSEVKMVGHQISQCELKLELT